MAKIPLFIVDAFVGALEQRVLRGNPAAVALLDAPRDEIWMQEIAAEMNLSETAFVSQKDAQNFDLRWFTPTCEVELCGHATLASAHILWQCGRLDPAQCASFHTQSGVLTARKREGDEVALDFPAQSVEAAPAWDALSVALGAVSSAHASFWKANDDWLIEFPPGTVENLRPLFAELRGLCLQSDWRGVIATEKAAQGAPYDFVSRFFGPAVGIDEDPVTGSAHTKLAPFWGAKLGKSELVGYQASLRGGRVKMKLQGTRVELSGRALTRMRGELAG